MATTSGLKPLCIAKLTELLSEYLLEVTQVHNTFSSAEGAKQFCTALKGVVREKLDVAEKSANNAEAARIEFLWCWLNGEGVEAKLQTLLENKPQESALAFTVLTMVNHYESVKPKAETGGKKHPAYVLEC